MKRGKRELATFLSVIMIVGNILNVSAAGYWQLDSSKWYHKTEGILDTGWLSEGEDTWYFLNADGAMQTGWHQDMNGSRYYFNQPGEGIEGKMRYGWFQNHIGDWYFFNTEHDGFFGKVVTGWQWIDGYCYYFDANGQMIANGLTPDGYQVDENGRWIKDGILQYQLGKGFQSKHSHTFAKGSNNRNSSGSSGGASGGSGGNNYKVFENANKDSFTAKESVKAFSDKSQEDILLLQSLADSIVDYWVDAETVDIMGEDTNSNNTFQSVLEINFAVRSDSVLLDEIERGHVELYDTVYIPSCKAFPAGMAFVYLGHDDDYSGEMINSYDSKEYEVIHATEISFSDLFDEEISYSAGGVNNNKAIQYMWSPALYGDELVSNLEFSPKVTSQDSEEYMTSDKASPSDSGELIYSEDLENDFVATPSDLPATASQINLLSLKRTRKASSDKNRFKISQKATEKGHDILVEAKDMVLYDVDGNLDTSEDQILLNGKIGVENLNPELGFQWAPNAVDLMPKQLKAVIEYDKVIELKFQAQDEVNFDDFIEKTREAFKQPENKQELLGIELQGVDLDNTIVLACFGVNIGFNRVSYNMSDIQSMTKDITTGLQPMVVFMVLMDINGNISVTTTLEMENKDSTKEGINIQKDGFRGSWGTVSQNKGDYNAKIGDYNVNIYNRHDTETTVTLNSQGDASVDVGVGLGAGIMCLGIMPAMIKGTVGIETRTSGSCEASWNNKKGFICNAEGEVELRSYLKAQALIKLKTKIDWWLLQVEAGIDQQFNLADITLFEEKFTPHISNLRYDNSYEKYFDYSEKQLAKEFHSYKLATKPENSLTVEQLIYYNGEEGLPTWKDDGNEYVDMERLDSSNDILICIIRERHGDSINGEGILTYRIIYTRVKNIIKGTTENTIVSDLKNVGTMRLVDIGSGESIYALSFMPFLGEMRELLAHQCWTWDQHMRLGEASSLMVKGMKEEELDKIYQKYIDSSGLEMLEKLRKELEDYMLPKKLNTEAYITVQ